jgi:repressor LexA
MQGLTKKQQEILWFIQDFIENHKLSPSYREIMEHFGFSSLGSVYKHLKALEEKGLISKAKNRSRSVTPQILPEADSVEIPFLGMIAAGLPIETFSESETVAIPKYLVPQAEKCFALKVTGNSMIDDHILDGDMIIAIPKPKPQNGDIVIALINHGEATLKRFYAERDHVRLEPANADFEPIYVPHDAISIQGVIAGLFRSF